jgi:glutamine cyclotransferase
VYDPQSLKKLAEYPWEKPEGWGITHNDTSLIVSDGTSNIYLVDPVSLKITRTIPVTDNNGPVNNINELEYIRGFVYANQWGSDYVLKIDLSTGVVVGKADFTGILARYAKEDMNQFKYRAQNAVLNGIAYDPATNRTFITGKLWPVVFEIKFE